MSLPIIDEARVAHVLTVFAQAHAGEQETALPTEAELKALLQAEIPESEVGTVTQGELMRAALDVIANDDRFSNEVQTLVSGPAPEKMAVIESAAIISAVLIVLQTHVRFERKPGGKWTLLIEKRPANNKLLDTLVSKLLSYWEAGGG